MDFQAALSLIREFLVLILIFSALLAYAIVRGRRALLALILGLYTALLLSLKFPYYEQLFALTAREGNTDAILTIVLFAVFTGASAFLFERLLSVNTNEESPFEGIGKKGLLALLGTVLVIGYCYHVLPVATLIDPSARIDMLFAPEQYFFWLLIAPLVGLFFI